MEAKTNTEREGKTKSMHVSFHQSIKPQQIGCNCYPAILSEIDRYASSERSDGGKIRNHSETV